MHIHIIIEAVARKRRVSRGAPTLIADRQATQDRPQGNPELWLALRATAAANRRSTKSSPREARNFCTRAAEAARTHAGCLPA